MRLLLIACLPLAACTPPVDNQADANAVVENVAVVAPSPSPSPPPAEPRENARYRCMDGSKIAVRYQDGGQRATIVRTGKTLATIDTQPGAGLHYARGGYELRGTARDLSFTQPNLPPLPCTVIR